MQRPETETILGSPALAASMPNSKGQLQDAIVGRLYSKNADPRTGQINDAALLGDLYQVDPESAMQYEKHLADLNESQMRITGITEKFKPDLDKIYKTEQQHRIDQADVVANVLRDAQDQLDYTERRNFLKQLGLEHIKSPFDDNEYKIPEVFDKKFIAETDQLTAHFKNIELQKVEAESAAKKSEETQKSTGQAVNRAMELQQQHEFATKEEEQKFKHELILQKAKEQTDIQMKEREKFFGIKALGLGKDVDDAMTANFEGAGLLGDLVETYKKNNYGNVSDIIGESTAKIPFFGKWIAPEMKAFQNQKRTIAETFLRAATGAAAPEHEVTTYTGFLPDASDPPDVAQAKIDNFMNKISQKTEGRIKSLKAQGKALISTGSDEVGMQKYFAAESLLKTMEDSKNEIPRIGEKAEKIINKEQLEEPPARGASAKTSKGPAVGSIVNGYRFNGGDPNKKNSWEKVK